MKFQKRYFQKNRLDFEAVFHFDVFGIIKIIGLSKKPSQY